MIELKDDALEFSFPEVHPEARLRVEFQRTLRIPDDEKTHRSRRASAASRSATWTTRARGCRPRGSAGAASCSPCTSPRPCG